jgi:hypothetical protein
MKGLALIEPSPRVPVAACLEREGPIRRMVPA